MVPVKDHDAGVAALDGGTADAYASDRAIIIGVGRRFRSPEKLSLVEELFSYEPYGLILWRNDAAFRLSVNRALAPLYRPLIGAMHLINRVARAGGTGNYYSWNASTGHAIGAGDDGRPYTPWRRDPMRTVLGLTAVMLVLATGCATTQRQQVEDQPAICTFLGESCGLLKPGGSDEASLRYVNPNAQLTQYNKVIVEVVGFFGSDSAKVPLTDQQALTDLFRKTLNDELAKKYPIVDKPGPGVARVRVAMLDAEAATPGVRSVTMVVPQTRLLTTGVSLVTGKYPFSGGAQAVAKVSDSMTGQVLGAGADRRTGGGSIQAAAQWQWGDAENAIKKWCELITNGLYAYTSGAKKP